MENTVHAIGRRKEAVAKVWIKPGNGNILVNNKEVKKYFDRDFNVFHMLQPLDATSTRDKYDVVVKVLGGGKTGQAGAEPFRTYTASRPRTCFGSRNAPWCVSWL